MSRNVSTCRSGMTSRCVSACGLMSWIATKPSAGARRGRPRGRLAEEAVLRLHATIPSSVTAARAHAHELADRARRRATASSRRRSRGRGGRRARRPRARASSRQRRRHASCESGAQARAALLLHLRRHRVVGGGRRSGPRRVREDVHLRRARPSPTTRSVARERRLVLGREADDHVGRQVEVRERRQTPQVGRRGVAAAHRAQHAVVARLERDVQVPRDGRRLAQRARRARR